MAAEVTPGEAYEIKGVTTLTGPRRGRPRVPLRGPCERSSREHIQPGRWGAQGERGPTGSCLCWAQMEYTSIGREVSSLVCLNVTSLQSGKGRKGNLW